MRNRGLQSLLEPFLRLLRAIHTPRSVAFIESKWLFRDR